MNNLGCVIRRGPVVGHIAKPPRGFRFVARPVLYLMSASQPYYTWHVSNVSIDGQSNRHQISTARCMRPNRDTPFLTAQESRTQKARLIFRTLHRTSSTFVVFGAMKQ